MLDQNSGKSFELPERPASCFQASPWGIHFVFSEGIVLKRCSLGIMKPVGTPHYIGFLSGAMPRRDAVQQSSEAAAQVMYAKTSSFRYMANDHDVPWFDLYVQRMIEPDNHDNNTPRGVSLPFPYGVHAIPLRPYGVPTTRSCPKF